MTEPRNQEQTPKKTYHPSLLYEALDYIKQDKAWRTSSIYALLLEMLRSQGNRITDKAREECWNAATDAIAKHEGEETRE